MLVYFHSVGREPRLSNLLKRSQNEGAISWAVSLSVLAGISSGPEVLFTSRLDKTARSWLVVTVKSHSSGWPWTSSTQSGRQMSASCVETDTKYWLNKLTISLDEVAEIRLPSSAVVDITPSKFRRFGFNLRINQKRSGLDLKSNSLSEKKSHVPRVFYTWPQNAGL